MLLVLLSRRIVVQPVTGVAGSGQVENVVDSVNLTLTGVVGVGGVGVIKIGGWTNVDDVQNANWAAITTTQNPGWTNVTDTQSPAWTDVNKAA